MNIPKFTAQASLYRTSRHYRMTATFDDAYGTMYPAVSITDFVKISPDFFDLHHSVPIAWVNPRACCRNCLASFPCVDESCRRHVSLFVHLSATHMILAVAHARRVEQSVRANAAGREKYARPTDAVLQIRPAKVAVVHQVGAVAAAWAVVRRVGSSVTIAVVHQVGAVAAEWAVVRRVCAVSLQTAHQVNSAVVRHLLPGRYRLRAALHPRSPFSGAIPVPLALVNNSGDQKKLVFSGNGRIQLRFWSDNYYSNQGWIAPMGEYLIDIRFVFLMGGRTASVVTGPFKIDV